MATASLTAATTNGISVSRTKDYAAYNGTVTFNFTPNTLLTSTDKL